MNWDAVGAIGEVVGGVAVLATLVYLALQTRQVRIAAEANGTLQAIEWYGRWRAIHLENSDIAAVLAKANSGQSLNDQESIQFNVLFEELIWVVAVSYANSSRGGSIHDPSSEVDYLVDRLQSNRGAVDEWHRRKELVAGTSRELVALVDRRLLESKKNTQ